MKKWFAFLLAAAMVLSLAACQKEPAPTEPQTPAPTEAPTVAPTEKPTEPPTEAPTEPPKPLSDMARVIILNNAFEGLDMSSQCYNAEAYFPSYKLGELVEENFWFLPEDETTTFTTAYTDGYTGELDYKTFKGVFVAFPKDLDGAYDYEIYTGKNFKKSWDVQYKGWVVIGPEAILFMQQDDPWEIPELFAEIGMVDAESYEFVCADGWSETITKEDLAECQIFWNKDGGVDATSIAYPTYSLMNIQYIVPTGLTQESELPEEGIVKINVALNMQGVLDVEPPYAENYAGTWYSSWSVADLLARYDIAVEGDVVATAYTDGFSKTESVESFAAKYIAYQAPKDDKLNKEYFTLGRTQAKNDGVTNVGTYVLKKDCFAFIPGGGLNLGELLEKIDFQEAADYILTYADGKEEIKTFAELKELTVQQDSKLLSITPGAAK